MKYTMTRQYHQIKIDTEKGTVSGDTYAVKEWIKETFTGIRWNGELKAWAMDAAELAKIIEEKKEVLVRVQSLREVATTEKTTSYVRDSLCPICHTYCNGDCTASKH